MMTPEPTRWLVDHARLLPAAGDALDVACGSGRNALWLAARGLSTLAIDRDADKIEAIRRTAEERQLPLRAEVVDLESTVESGFSRIAAVESGFSRTFSQTYDLIVVVHYLHRPLFPALRDALRPGGILVYETFTRAQAQRGKPTNPAFLLEPGELRELVAPLDVVAEREGDFEGKMLASVIAVRPLDRAQGRR
jgi:SAM-dependent methyltransferase